MIKKKKELKTLRFGKRLMALLLALVMILQIGSVIFTTVFAESTEITKSETVTQDGIAITTKKTLSYLGNSTYKLQLTATSSIKQTDQTRVRTMSEDGVFTVPDDGAGYYLIELWGGTGGRGSDVYQPLWDETWQGGKGGQAGYTYGYIRLEAGNSLVYTLGTNGANVTRSDNGGGENEGGSAGENGLYGVGGGGGYSAVYKFDNKRTSNKITEAERLTNYIMIAGGGGGGGAANEAFTQTRTADGGNGGSASPSAAVRLSAQENDGVAGVYFRGSNGKSSGTSVDYVGIGGSRYPGELSHTFINWYDTKPGNNWKGDYNSDLTPGSGGDSNLRGGAGGAGFTGGSGGIMASSLIAANVGGGGGGSSFISDKVTWQNLPERVKGFMHKTNDNTSGKGGKIIITYLGENPETGVDTSHLTKTVISGKISKYFDIVDASVTNGKFTNSCTISHTNDGKVEVTGANIAPMANGFEDTANACVISITFKAKEGFLGGNKVPVIENDFTLTPQGKKSITYVKNNDADYCNVPLNFNVTTNSYAFNQSNPKSYQITQLYNDTYSAYRANPSGYWQSEFINTISAYKVTVAGSTTALSGTVSPNSTTKYTVSFTVTPKYSQAKVGPASPSGGATFSGTAIITALGENQIQIGDTGDTVAKVSKTLSYYDNTYHLKVNIAGNTEVRGIPYPMIKSSGEGSTTIQAPGYYSIAVRGGNGGGGGGATYSLNTNRTASGGTGATAQIIKGFIYLNKGDVVSWSVGANGTTASNQSSTSPAVTGSGGTGGKCSWIKVNGEYIIISAGGGGGGGAAVYGTATSKTSTSHGASASANTAFNTSVGTISSYNGANGAAGTSSYSNGAAGGSAGSTPKSYKSSRLLESFIKPDGKQFTIDESISNGSLTSSRAILTMAVVDSVAIGNYSGFSLDTSFSRYFDVVAVTVDNNKEGTTATVTGAGGTTALFTCNVSGMGNGSRVSLTNLKYDGHQAHTVSGAELVVSASMNLTFDFALKPKKEFLGGNDVPVLQYNTFSTGTDDYGVSDYGIRFTRSERQVNNANYEKQYFVSQQNATDYANVALKHTFIQDEFKTHDTVITCGESVNLNSLIDSNVMSLPSGQDAWKAEFVKFVSATGSTVAPTENMNYKLSQFLAPKAEATKAVIVPSVSSIENSRYPMVYVQYKVSADGMAHLTYDGPSIVSSGDSLEGKIVPEDGYLLPDSITVTVNGKALSSGSFSYNSETGAFSVQADKINGNIVLGGQAKTIQHKLTFRWIGEDNKTYEESRSFMPGTNLTNDSWFKSFVNKSFSDRDHYTFLWTWGTEGNVPLEEMPALDTVIVGNYYPNVYTVTIHYIQDGQQGVALAPDRVIKGSYGMSYSEISPAIPGWATDTPVVTGAYENNTDIYVKYTAAQSNLYVYYFYSDSNTEAQECYTQTIRSGDSYDVPTPAISGYTPNRTAVKGTVSNEDAEKGIVAYVYYEPNKVKVTFDASGGEIFLAETEKNVLYNNIYSYDADDETYTALPIPFRTGYKFLGWFTDEIGGTQIKEDTKVTALDEQTVYAHWEALEYTVYISYRYLDSTGKELNQSDWPTGAQAETNVKVKCDSYYNISLPDYPGFVRNPNSVSGTMGATDIAVTVTYTRQTYTLTIEYKYADDVADANKRGKTASETVTLTGIYGTPYDVSSPQIDGYAPSLKKVSGTMTSNTQITVIYSDYTELVSSEIEWGNLTFNLTDVVWNAEDHQYEGHNYSPEAISGNYIKVLNDGNVDLKTEYTYTASEDYQDNQCYFTAFNDSTAEHITSMDVFAGQQITAWVWIDGECRLNYLPNQNTSLQFGTCTIIISKKVVD